MHLKVIQQESPKVNFSCFVKLTLLYAGDPGYSVEIEIMSCVMCGRCSSVHKHVFDHVCVVFHYYLTALEQH